MLYAGNFYFVSLIFKMHYFTQYFEFQLFLKANEKEFGKKKSWKTFFYYYRIALIILFSLVLFLTNLLYLFNYN